jgi:hypothetical protein
MEREIYAALDRATRDNSFLLVPVILPGGGREQLDEASLFLRQHQACDLREGFEGQAFDRLAKELKSVRSGAPHGKARREQAAANEILKTFERLQGRFSDSLRHNLAGGELIPRKETQEILELLRNEESQLVVVHGEAGAGKSGVLLELTRALQVDGTAYLPIRVDRLELQGDPERFGRSSLALPESPARSLALIGGDSPGVLVIDQLDALRWTGAHSSEAWDVCREVIEEALNPLRGLKVVVCCRTFDLQHDPQLRGWKNETKGLREVEVRDLSEEQVREAIGRVASQHGGTPAVGDREMKILRHIHHLQMWLTLYPNLNASGALDSRRALLEAFWEDRRARLGELRIDAARIDEIERRLLDEMRGGALLTAPKAALRLSATEIDAYQSLNILQVDPETRRVSFCHQSYLDYLVALCLVAEIKEGSGSIIAWLGGKEEQSLFRREQLRLVFEELRGREPGNYLAELRGLLEEEQGVRFHLRLLALQFLSQQEEPLSGEKNLILELVDKAYWTNHVLQEVVRGRVSWFEVLDDAGRLEEWLAGEDEKHRDAALEMLMYVVDKSGDRVARLLMPYVGSDQTWTSRVLWVLRSDPSKDSDALFNLRLDLARKGAFTGEHVDWGELAEKHPGRLLLLVLAVLIAFAESLMNGDDRRRPGRRSQLDWHTLEKVSTSTLPPDLQAAAWSNLFRAVVVVSKAGNYSVEEDRTLETTRVEYETLSPVLRLLRDLANSLLEGDWTEFVTMGEQLSRDDRRGETVFMDCLANGPADPSLADWALGWLMADPWRARLRLRSEGGEWWLATQLIERFAPFCSSETYDRLESWLLSYVEPDLLHEYRWRHERMQVASGHCDLRVPSSFGRTPHVLLSKLPPERASVTASKRLAELVRKFGPPAESDTAQGGRIEGGFIQSPLSKDATERMSDEAWLALALNEKLRRGQPRLRWSEGRIEEASTETIASDFRQAAQREPERFGRLLTRWPANGEPTFLKATLSGLAYPGDRKQGKDQEEWEPPSHDLLERVLLLPAVVDLAKSEGDTRIAGDICSIVRRYAEHPWSDSALQLVVWIAKHHRDPGEGYFPVGREGDDSETFDFLESNALNVTRGSAGFTVRAVLFKHPSLFETLRPSIESLIRDPHPAVRVAALAACLPVINIDRDLAVKFFLEAVEGQQDALLATREAREFLRYTYRTHLSQILPSITRMVASDHPKVSTAGAVLVAAAYLVEGEVEDLFEGCISGTSSQRKGVAEVAGSLLSEGEWADKAKAALLRLAEDEDVAVAGVVARSFEQLDMRHITSDRQAWGRFARSKAFQADPTPLLRALERQSGDLLPFADCLLAAGTTFGEELAESARDYSHGIAGDASLYLLPLLLRLYEQAKEGHMKVYLGCLDLWDRLLEQRVGSAMGLTKELDRE